MSSSSQLIGSRVITCATSKRKLDLCHASTGARSELSLNDNSQLRSWSFPSKTRETFRVEGEWLERCKQRQVNLLTKSSLRLPLDHTVVYIQRDLEITSKTQSRKEQQRNESKGIEQNRMEANEVKGVIEWNRVEQKEREHTRSVIGPQGAGPCMQVSKISYRESWPNKWTKPIGHGTLRVTCDSWCHALRPQYRTQKRKNKRKEKDRPSELA